LVYAPAHEFGKFISKEIEIVTSLVSTGDAQFLVVDAVIGLATAVLFYSSKRLSNGYNAWTTRLRTRFRNINPPPTPEKAQSNYWTMVILFRIVGAFLFLASSWAAYDWFH
jgi:hypothetical protein